MSIRAVIPRLQSQTGKILRRCYITPRPNNALAKAKAAAQGQMTRSYCSRSVPVWRRRHPLESFFERGGPLSWPRGLIERQFRGMERLMEEMAPSSRLWWRDACYTRTTAGKEVDVKYTDRVFEVRMNVSQYAPEELSVRVAGDRLTVAARHEGKADQHGVISREFTRHFSVPENVDAESLESVLDADGYLVVRGVVRGAEDAKERVIAIQKGPADGGKDSSKASE